MREWSARLVGDFPVMLILDVFGARIHAVIDGLIRSAAYGAVCTVTMSCCMLAILEMFEYPIRARVVDVEYR